MAGNTLTFVELQNAVLGKRFPQSSLGDTKRWLATAYQDVWAAYEWPFRIVSRAPLALTVGEQPTVPADFADAQDVFDQYGCALERMEQRTLEEFYGDIFAFSLTGLPEAYTVVDRQLILAPLSSVTAGFTLSYRRRLCCRNADGTVAAGMMVNDTDYPVWDDHHSLLIPRAQVVGLQELNDPTYAMALQEYERQLSRMQDDYRPARVPVQWPKQQSYA